MKVSIEIQSDGTYIAYNTDGEHVQIIGTGNTVTEAKDDFFNSIEEVKADYRERGGVVPKELFAEVEFHFELSSFFEYFPMFNVSALGRYLGINSSLMRQYKQGATPISDAQLAKIEDGLHRLSRDLASLTLV